jgi:hypothetical protein
MTRTYPNLIGPVILLASIGIVSVDAIAAQSDGEMPIRSITITVREDSRDRFFDQLRKFADAHAFAIRIAPTTPDTKHFLLQMWREDIKVVGANPFDPPEAFAISFYKNGKHPVEPAAVNLVITDLKGAVSQMPGVTFSER